MNGITSADLDVILELIRNIKADYFKLFNETSNLVYKEKFEMITDIEKGIYLGNEKDVNRFWDFYEEYQSKDSDYNG